MNDYFVRRDHCPCCQSQAILELARSPLTELPLRDYLLSFYSAQGDIDFGYLQGQDYILVECQSCGLIYQQEVPGELLAHKLYEEWIDPGIVLETVEKRRTVGYFSGLSKEVASIIRYFGRPPSQLRFLDFGMGWGHWCRMAQAFGCIVYGTELSVPRIEYAKQMGVQIINYEEIAALQFDFINVEQVLEHLVEPGTTLTYLRECLRPQGVIKIGVPNGEDIKERLEVPNWQAPKGSSDSLNPVAPLEHLNCFDRATLVRIAGNYGLQPLESWLFREQNYIIQRAPRFLHPHLNRIRDSLVRHPNELRIFFKRVNN